MNIEVNGLISDSCTLKEYKKEYIIDISRIILEKGETRCYAILSCGFTEGKNIFLKINKKEYERIKGIMLGNNIKKDIINKRYENEGIWS